MNCRRLLLSATFPIFLLVAAAGCQGGGGGSAAADAPKYRAVVTRPSNGQPLVFLVPTGATGAGKVQALAADGAPVCEGCRAEAERYFRSGNMATNCAICNAGLSAVERRP